MTINLVSFLFKYRWQMHGGEAASVQILEARIFNKLPKLMLLMN